MDSLPVEIANLPALIPPTPPLRVVAQPSVFREPSARTIKEVPAGATLLDLVLGTDMGEMRDGLVHLLGPGKVVVTIDGNVIDRAFWHLVRPKAGALVNIYLAPQGQREALLIGGALAIGVLAIAAPYSLGVTSPLFASLLSAGIAVGGRYDLKRLIDDDL